MVSRLSNGKLLSQARTDVGRVLGSCESIIIEALNFGFQHFVAKDQQELEINPRRILSGESSLHNVTKLPARVSMLLPWVKSPFSIHRVGPKRKALKIGVGYEPTKPHQQTQLVVVKSRQMLGCIKTLGSPAGGAVDCVTGLKCCNTWEH